MRMHIPANSVKFYLKLNKIEAESVRHTNAHGIDRYEIVLFSKDDIDIVTAQVNNLIEDYVVSCGNPTPIIVIR